LEGALSHFQLDVHGLICLDVGASTGGFTDCLLQQGAQKVYAVDVGQGLLAHKLAQSEHVVVMDNTNARFLEAKHFAETIDLAVVDASFIGIGKLANALSRVLAPGKALLAMIKPQFEVGKAEAQRAKGVITDQSVRARAIAAAQQSLVDVGFEVLGGCDSVLAGPKGNVEYFCHAHRV
jgi:23S rRNA (cytidine1920-2'-O)/16S rRNA (cytidine1409-2'-O)-methyltransferase